MLTHTDVGAGYMFGLFPHDMIHVSSAGECRSSIGHWLSSISALGQVSGLVTTYYLMKQLQALFLNTYNDQDREESCVKDIHHANLSRHGRLGSTV